MSNSDDSTPTRTEDLSYRLNKASLRLTYAKSLAGLDRPDRRAIRLPVDLFTEQGGSNINYCWIIHELEATAAACRQVASNLRVQEQQAKRERRQRLQVVREDAQNR